MFSKNCFHESARRCIYLSAGNTKEEKAPLPPALSPYAPSMLGPSPPARSLLSSSDLLLHSLPLKMKNTANCITATKKCPPPHSHCSTAHPHTLWNPQPGRQAASRYFCLFFLAFSLSVYPERKSLEKEALVCAGLKGGFRAEDATLSPSVGVKTIDTRGKGGVRCPPSPTLLRPTKTQFTQHLSPPSTPPPPSSPIHTASVCAWEPSVPFPPFSHHSTNRTLCPLVFHSVASSIPTPPILS